MIRKALAAWKLLRKYRDPDVLDSYILQSAQAWHLLNDARLKAEESSRFWLWLVGARTSTQLTSKHIRIIIKVPLPPTHPNRIEASQHRSAGQKRRRSLGATEA